MGTSGSWWVVCGRIVHPAFGGNAAALVFFDQLMRYPSQEYQENNKNISIDDTQLNQVVQIYGCNNSVIKVSGKINAITMGEW